MEHMVIRAWPEPVPDSVSAVWLIGIVSGNFIVCKNIPFRSDRLFLRRFCLRVKTVYRDFLQSFIMFLARIPLWVSILFPALIILNSTDFITGWDNRNLLASGASCERLQDGDGLLLKT